MVYNVTSLCSEMESGVSFTLKHNLKKKCKAHWFYCVRFNPLHQASANFRYIYTISCMQLFSIMKPYCIQYTLKLTAWFFDIPISTCGPAISLVEFPRNLSRSWPCISIYILLFPSLLLLLCAWSFSASLFPFALGGSMWARVLMCCVGFLRVWPIQLHFLLLILC